MLTSLYLVPHGMQIVPGLEEPYPAGFRPLHEAMERAGEALRADGPDLLILLTPHGHTLAQSYLVYLHERFQGLLYELTESNVFGEVGSRRLWRGDRQAAEALLAAMQAAGLPAEGLVHATPNYPATLAWGETVPLTYLAEPSSPLVAIISLPRARSGDLSALQDSLTTLGRLLHRYALESPARVAIAVSADLSHTHSADGPYGAHESAAPFDRTVQAWVREPTRERLQALLDLQPTALACGLAGLCILQPILEATGLRCAWSTYAAPTYFGMLVCRWA